MITLRSLVDCRRGTTRNSFYDYYMTSMQWFCKLMYVDFSNDDIYRSFENPL